MLEEGNRRCAVLVESFISQGCKGLSVVEPPSHKLAVGYRIEVQTLDAALIVPPSSGTPNPVSRLLESRPHDVRYQSS